LIANAKKTAAKGVEEKVEVVALDVVVDAPKMQAGHGHRRYVSIESPDSISTHRHISKVNMDCLAFRQLCSTCMKKSDLQGSHGRQWVESGNPWPLSGFVPILPSLDPDKPTSRSRKSINYPFPTIGSSGCSQSE